MIVIDDLIDDMTNNRKLNSIITELFIRGRKLNISLAFITESFFKIPKDVRLNSAHFLIMKIPNKRELQQVALNNSSGINSKNFIKIYKKYTAEPYSLLVNDATLKKSFQYIIKPWPLMIRLEMKNYNMISTEKPPKYHQAKFLSMNILLVKKYYHLINNK